jgi:hypothetical protein
MLQRLRAWAPRLLWLFPIGLLLWLGVSLADYAWYRHNIPVTFFDANWSGRWTTTQYGGLSGRLLVRMPEPLPEGKTFRAEALVYYPIYSAWKTGAFVKMEFSGQFTPGSPASGGRSRNRIPGVVYEDVKKGPIPGMLKLRGVAGEQVVEYAAIIDETGTLITGGYLSEMPYDYGHFRIVRD